MNVCIELQREKYPFAVGSQIVWYPAEPIHHEDHENGFWTWGGYWTGYRQLESCTVTIAHCGMLNQARS